jgi:geranylgeranyl transferase type-2 subunit beta
MTGYLDRLDALLLDGAARLPGALRAASAGYVAGLQQSGGGFPGRAGGADLYYTDFALRALTLAVPGHPALSAAIPFLASAAPAVTVEAAFNACNAARMLRTPLRADATTFVRDLLTRPPATAYHAFLLLLCADIAGLPLPAWTDSLLALRCADGGFSTRAGETAGQANATAAVVGACTALDAVDGLDRAALVAFLAGLQAPDGGLRAHAAAPDGDLLSTFTGALTLAGLDALGAVRTGDLARFVRRQLLPGGGFRAGDRDTAPDIEYTYYGLATLSLLAGWAG